MNVPIASSAAGLQQQAQIADQPAASNPDCRTGTERQNSSAVKSSMQAYRISAASHFPNDDFEIA